VFTSWTAIALAINMTQSYMSLLLKFPTVPLPNPEKESAHRHY